MGGNRLKNKWIWLSILLVFILGIGGIGREINGSKKISIEQQNNVATWIVRSYDNVKKITFLKFYQDENTGTVGINFKINNDDRFKSGIVVDTIAEFDTNVGIVGLSPINTFEKLVPSNKKKDYLVDLKKVEINYLEE